MISQCHMAGSTFSISVTGCLQVWIIPWQTHLLVPHSFGHNQMDQVIPSLLVACSKMLDEEKAGSKNVRGHRAIDCILRWYRHVHHADGNATPRLVGRHHSTAAWPELSGSPEGKAPHLPVVQNAKPAPLPGTCRHSGLGAQVPLWAGKAKPVRLHAQGPLAHLPFPPKGRRGFTTGSAPWLNGRWSRTSPD